MRIRLRLTPAEAGIVAVVLSAMTAVTGANAASRRLRANESSALRTLRRIESAQAQFQALGVVDADGDEIGEFGLFREMAGSIAMRTALDGSNTGGRVLDPPLLPSRFRRLNANAEVRHGGYLFKVFLPGAGGQAQEEVAPGTTDTLDGTADSDHAESTWCCYAWPARNGRSGRRTFFLNQAGTVISTRTFLYSGTGDIDEGQAGAAFRAGEGSSGSITGVPAVGTVGRDGNVWRVVE